MAGGSRRSVVCERDCAACTKVTLTIRVDAPLLKRPSSNRRMSRTLDCAIIKRASGRKGHKVRERREARSMKNA